MLENHSKAVPIYVQHEGPGKHELSLFADPGDESGPNESRVLAVIGESKIASLDHVEVRRLINALAAWTWDQGYLVVIDNSVGHRVGGVDTGHQTRLRRR